MNITRLVLSLIFLVLPALAEDSSIATLDRTLTPIIRKFIPDAEIDVSATKYEAKYGTMDFTVHGRSMTGEVSPKTHLEEGPNYEGFMLQVEVHEGEYQGQAAVPGGVREPYWTTFLDAPSVPSHNQYLWIRFSFGSRLDAEFQKALLNALPKSSQ